MQDSYHDVLVIVYWSVSHYICIGVHEEILIGFVVLQYTYLIAYFGGAGKSAGKQIKISNNQKFSYTLPPEAKLGLPNPWLTGIIMKCTKKTKGGT